jgi:hypothetical protein
MYTPPPREVVPADPLATATLVASVPASTDAGAAIKKIAGRARRAHPVHPTHPAHPATSRDHPLPSKAPPARKRQVGASQGAASSPSLHGAEMARTHGKRAETVTISP